MCTKQPETLEAAVGNPAVCCGNRCGNVCLLSACERLVMSAAIFLVLFPTLQFKFCFARLKCQFQYQKSIVSACLSEFLVYSCACNFKYHYHTQACACVWYFDDSAQPP